MDANNEQVQQVQQDIPQENIANNTGPSAPDPAQSKMSDQQATAQNQTSQGANFAPPVAQGNHGQSQNEGQPAPDDNSVQADNAGAWKDLANGIEGLDEALAQSFTKFAQENHYTPEQAQGLIKWQLEALHSERKRLTDLGVRELTEEWGAQAQANNQAALKTVSYLDRLTNGAFMRCINSTGIACHADFVRTMYQVSKLIDEDSLGHASGGSQPEKVESALEGVRDLYRRAGVQL